MKRRYKIGGSLILLASAAVVALGLTLSYDSDCEPAPALAAGTAAMKAVTYHCYGSADVLEYGDVAKPTPADDEVLVKVAKAAVNPYDWHYMRGSPYLMRVESGIGAPKDSSFGVDFAGTVEAVGSKVTRFKPGDAVFGGAGGAFAEYLTVREHRGVTHKPANVTLEQAAGVGIAGITALQALRDKGQLKVGQKVLINGASGGVGTFAVQIAKALGAEVTGVCSTRNVDMVLGLGADRVIDYKKSNYTEDDVQYDLIVDMVGNHSLSANRRVLTPQGRMVMIGGPKGDWIAPMINPLKALFYNPFVDQEIGMMVSAFEQDDMVTLAELMATGQVTPIIDRHYPLAELADAIRYSETSRARGKIIVDVAP